MARTRASSLLHHGLVRLVQAAEMGRLRLERAARDLVPPHFALLNEIAGARYAQAICTAAALGLADHLDRGPIRVHELARAIPADEDALRRLIVVLSSRGIFGLDENDNVTLTRLAAALRSNGHPSVRSSALLTGQPTHWNHWAHLEEAIRTGRPQVPAIRGMSLFDYAAEDSSFGRVFHQAMVEITELTSPSILHAYDFGSAQTIVDIGGGRGQLLSAILRSAPASRGVLFDLPGVLADAPPVLSAGGVADRCDLVPGSFFDAHPVGGDLYILKAVLHDWPEEEALRILRRAREAMSDDSRLVVVEMLIPEGRRPHPAHLLDLDMLLTHGGRERSAGTYSRLLGEGGFRVTRIFPTLSPLSVIEAAPDALVIRTAPSPNALRADAGEPR